MSEWIYGNNPSLPPTGKAEDIYLVSIKNPYPDAIGSSLLGKTFVTRCFFDYKGRWSGHEWVDRIYAYQPLPDPAPLPEEVDE